MLRFAFHNGAFCWLVRMLELERVVHRRVAEAEVEVEQAMRIDYLDLNMFVPYGIFMCI